MARGSVLMQKVLLLKPLTEKLECPSNFFFPVKTPLLKLGPIWITGDLDTR